MTKHDIVLIFIILILAGTGFAITAWVHGSNDPVMAEISLNGKIITKIDLTHPPQESLLEVSGPLGTSIVEIRPGAIRMQHSPCPDRYCMKTGWIDRPGQVIVCVPNRIMLKISSRKNIFDTVSH